MADISPTQATQQVEAARYRSGVSESLLQKIGGNINYLLSAVLPVGSVIYSMLSESQFQGETTTGWVLADGRSCSGSDYELITGNSTVPDLRGVFLRGKNHARSGATGNPDGDLALGTFTADKVGSHYHQQRGFTLDLVGGPVVRDEGSEYSVTTQNTQNAGGNETAPRNVTLNCFVRIA